MGRRVPPRGALPEGSPLPRGPCPRGSPLPGGGPEGPFATHAEIEPHDAEAHEMIGISTGTPTAAPSGMAQPGPNWIIPRSHDRARLTMDAALGEGIRLAAAAGDIDAVQVAQEAITRLLGRSR